MLYYTYELLFWEDMMFDTRYKVTEENVWTGRIDSETNYDAFRLHQWVQRIDLRNETIELDTGRLGIAFIGFCCDEGVRRNLGRVGAAKGPENIRKALSNLPCRFTQDVRIFDAGDIVCEDDNLEQSQEILAKAVGRILGLNLFPIVLGGGHEVAFGHYMGILNHLSEVEQKPNIGVINFDAHFDLRPYPNGGSSGTMFRQIADVCECKGMKYSYFCVGVQKHSNTIELFRTAEKLGVQYVLEKDIEGNRFAHDISNSDEGSIMERLDSFIKQNDHIYITICADVFSSAFAPGVSATQPLGLHPEAVLKFIKHLLKSQKTVSFDIAEVSPRFDLDNTTANLAKVLIFAVIDTLASMKNLSL
jgi:formiminoglutamase